MIDLRDGDCRHVLASLPDASVDAVVTDPPYELGFMGKKWDGTGIAYDVAMWAEVLRVLKPGGHLLSFGGTRTWHRMACAVEDAGFEMRDSIAWLYGSGFPKSLDVGKAIDKLDAADEQTTRRLRFTAWVRSTGATARQIDEATGTNMGGHYTTASSQPAIMTAEHLDACRHLLGEVPEWVEDECRIRSVESANFAEREVIGTKKAVPGVAFATTGPSVLNVTAPATPEAERWDGWGTALKPAHEPIVVARKPFPGTVAANVVEHGTGALNIDGCRIGTDTSRGDRYGGRPAGNSVGQTTFTQGVKSQPWDVPAGRWPANVVLDDTTATILDEQSLAGGMHGAGAARSKILASPDRPDAAAYAVTGGERDCRRLGDDGGASRFFKRVDWSEGDSVVAWRQDRATTADNSSSQPRPADGSAPSDAATSASLAAKPSSSSQTGRPTTVATPSASRPNAETGTPAMPTTASASWQGQPPDEHSQTPSRARSAETPTLTGTTTTTPSRSPSGGSAANTTSAGTSSSTAPGVKVLDGADRFIYCAKAPTKERPRHDGTAHPTVKPLTLMRWLVRLVTPPDGTVLDPFAGSGTTLEAALLEGFHAIGIEANPDYLPLIRQRLARHDSTLFGATA